MFLSLIECREQICLHIRTNGIRSSQDLLTARWSKALSIIIITNRLSACLTDGMLYLQFGVKMRKWSFIMLLIVSPFTLLSGVRFQCVIFCKSRLTYLWFPDIKPNSPKTAVDGHSTLQYSGDDIVICMSMSDGVWIGDSVYWPLYHTSRNYK